eukprot:SAG31_NODE_4920_length_2867_cov_1.714595_1_plen_155_part_00
MTVALNGSRVDQRWFLSDLGAATGYSPASFQIFDITYYDPDMHYTRVHFGAVDESSTSSLSRLDFALARLEVVKSILDRAALAPFGPCSLGAYECSWTANYSCPGQPIGSMGPAVDDNTINYECCCTEGLWAEKRIAGLHVLRSHLRGSELCNR